ncbi:MAG: hypothetical protein DRO63_08345, partial [Candidatus Gerdarchaeota archaeon]
MLQCYILHVKGLTMITKRELLVKAFTIREPSYQKKTSNRTIAAEREMNEKLQRTDIESTADPKNEGDFLILFVHGFAASKYCWLDPDIGNLGWVKDYRNDPPPRDFGWHAIPPPPFFGVDWSLSKQLTPIGASEILDKHNIEWLTYSQKSAFGPIETSVKELEQIIATIKAVYGNRRIIIIAHSRGGLISKYYLSHTKKTSVEKLITFGTPFGGTFLSAIELFHLPSKLFLNKVKTVRKLWDFHRERKIESISTKQMAPNSDFLLDLEKRGCRKDVKFVNVAGSCSLITNVYVWQWNLSSLKPQFNLAFKKHALRKQLIQENKPPKDWYNLPELPIPQCFNWILKPRKLFHVYPSIGYKEVLMGDGAVAVESALLKDPEVKQYIIHRNHFDMTCCPEAYKIMMDEINKC